VGTEGTGQDPVEFSRVYETYRGRVLAYAAKLIGPADAEDVTQEVFVKVGRALGTLTDPAKLSSWIYTITLNTVRDLARARASRAEAASPDLDAVSPDRDADRSASSSASGTHTPEEIAIRNEMVACYLDFVKQLPANYYEVYALSEFEDLSNEEIAGRLSLTLSTTKIRLHRARSRVNAELRKNCRCYYNARGELMGEPNPK
jgi:RNA polymerase sigma-70 factor (ECF subfamily)